MLSYCIELCFDYIKNNLHVNNLYLSLGLYKYEN